MAGPGTGTASVPGTLICCLRHATNPHVRVGAWGRDWARRSSWLERYSAGSILAKVAFFTARINVFKKLVQYSLLNTVFN
jgi:hypothetical protein